MYESFFELEQRPFDTVPHVDRYYPAAAIESARDILSRTIERAEGIGLVIGPAGCGKTLLMQVLAEQYRDRFSVAAIGGLKLSTPRALLQAILFEAGLPYRRMEEGEMRLALLDHLRPSEKCPEGLLLLFDECHTLPPKLLEELRLLTNVVRNGRPRVRLVLAGNGVMEDRFAQPRMASFQQRITARCYLEPFSRQETLEYIQSQLAASGGEWSRVMTEAALAAAHQAADGVPRVINQICDHALVMAAAGGVRPVDASGIEEAWADLQQLPLPWNAPEESETASNTVEFGSLDDEEEAQWREVPPQPAAERQAAEPARKPEIAPPHIEPPEPFRRDEAASEADPPAEPEPIEEPMRQLERIEQQVETVHREFYPPGRHQPEAILRVEPLADEPPDGRPRHGGALPATSEPEMTPAADPFGGQDFEDEEVVIDPGHQLPVDLLFRPSGAVRDPANAPAPADDPEPETAPRLVPMQFYDDVVLPEIDLIEADAGDCAESEPLPREDPVLPEDALEQSPATPPPVQPWTAESAPAENDQADDDVTTLPLHSFVDSRGDGDLIVVEEEQESVTIPKEKARETAETVELSAGRHRFAAEQDDQGGPTCDKPAGEQRQQEYRNLFAKLRRGE